MRFTWDSRKLKHKQHLADENGKSLCKLENGGWKANEISDSPHSTKKICGICLQLKARPQKRAQRPKKQAAGPKPPRDSFLHSREWKEVRYRALKMAKGRCECCGRGTDDGYVLHVDHIKPRFKHPELALSLSNLQVLCASCNLGKGGWDETDWREPRLATLMGEAVD